MVPLTVSGTFSAVKVPLNPCYILHQRPYRETSLILEVFSREHGKLSVVAKGVRKGRNNQRAIMQPTRKVNMAWVSRGEMGTLTAIEPEGPGCELTGPKLIAAFYLNELLMRLLHKYEPCTDLFDAYDRALTQLQRHNDEQVVLRLFEKRLLETLGYGLVLEHDVVTGKVIDKEKLYYYLLESGPTESPYAGREQIKISGKTLRALANDSLRDKQDLDEAKRLIRRILKDYLGPRPLESRELFRAYLKNRS